MVLVSRLRSINSGCQSWSARQHHTLVAIIQSREKIFQFQHETERKIDNVAMFSKDLLQKTSREVNVYTRHHQTHPFAVCVEVLQSSQPNGVMSSAVSLPNHTFTGQA